MNVSLFSKYGGFPSPLTAHIHLGVFAASKSDIVQIRSVVPCHTPQLLVADATAAKVGPTLKWSSFMLNFSF